MDFTRFDLTAFQADDGIESIGYQTLGLLHKYKR